MGGSKQANPDMETLKKNILELRREVDGTRQIIVANENDLARLNKEKEKQQRANIGVKQRMQQIESIF